MYKPIKYIFIFVLLLSVSAVLSQENLKKLSVNQALEIVKQNHPVAKQASLLIEKAKADITVARGGFDPLLYNTNAKKTFDGTEYYQYNRSELKIPTWFGVEVYAGLEELAGARTDPTETIGKTSYFGLSVPLAKNLLMDKRRAALQTAKIFRNASEVERRNILNNLLLDALNSYWQWMMHYQNYKIFDDAVSVNEKRIQLVRSSFLLGDRPAIDTTEAITQLQTFQVLREKAWMEFQNAGLELSAFLWRQNDEPVALPADAIPGDEYLLASVSGAPLPSLDELIDAAKNNHPELLLYTFKLAALEIEKKLKLQSLLPTINLKYNQLGKGYDLLKTANGTFFDNNFRYGITAGLSLRLSEGRGEYRQAKLKITETQLQQNLKSIQVENKIRSYFNELFALKRQAQIQEEAYKNYIVLQRGEEVRFQSGESSLFLVNARENKALEALQKLQELRSKYLITSNRLQWAAGLLML